MNTKFPAQFSEEKTKRVRIMEIRPGITEISLEDGAILELKIVPSEVYRTD